MISYKKIIAGLFGTSTLVLGGVDASVLEEIPVDKIEIIANERVEAKQIGNVVETNFPWKNQPGFKVKYDMGEPTIEEKLLDKRKKEVITEPVDYGDGGFKVDIILNEKPTTNCFSYTIEGHENYDFFYQPPLTEEEIARGDIRPEDVVGSYAVYHKTLKDHIVGRENYATGKVAHIPYPYVWELNNEKATKERAESFTIDNGVMTVCASQKFIDKANYPVRIDPTFGYTTIGSTEFEISSDSFFAPNFFVGNLALGGTVSSVSFYGRTETSNRDFIAAIYSSSTLMSPQSSASTVNSTTAQWWTNTFSGPTISANNATATYPGVILDYVSATENIHIYRDTSSGIASKILTGLTYPTLPNPATFSNSTYIYSVYATIETPITIGLIGVSSESTLTVNTFISSFLYTAPVTGVLDYMGVYYVADNSTKMKMAIYDSAFDTLIATTTEVNPTIGWNTAELTSSTTLTAGTDYRLTLWNDGSSGSTISSYNLSKCSNIYTNNHSYTSLSGVFPSNPDNEFTITYCGAIFATYLEESGGGGGGATSTAQTEFWFD